MNDTEVKYTGLDKYTSFKRKIYLVVFPIMILANAYYWLFSPYVDKFMEIALQIFNKKASSMNGRG